MLVHKKKKKGRRRKRRYLYWVKFKNFRIVCIRYCNTNAFITLTDGDGNVIKRFAFRLLRSFDKKQKKTSSANYNFGLIVGRYLRRRGIKIIQICYVGQSFKRRATCAGLKNSKFIVTRVYTKGSIPHGGCRARKARRRKRRRRRFF